MFLLQYSLENTNEAQPINAQWLCDLTHQRSPACFLLFLVMTFLFFLSLLVLFAVLSDCFQTVRDSAILCHDLREDQPIWPQLLNWAKGWQWMAITLFRIDLVECK